MSRSDIGQRVALLLFEAGAIHISRQQPFILAAGWASPAYVDCRVLIGEPETRRGHHWLAAAYLASVFPASLFDAIAGAETAGIPFATLLAEHSDWNALRPQTSSRHRTQCAGRRRIR